MDAPYESGLNMEALRILGNKEFKYEDTLIVCEDLKEADYSEVLSLGYEIVKEKIYKTNKHIFIRKAGEEKADD
jgi:16S rRNA (guanine966-N2)-methyltransferase